MRNWRMAVVIGLLVVGAAAQHGYAEQSDGGKAPMVRKGERMTEQQMIERRLSYMTQKLALTAEQQTAIKPILEEERAKLNEIANDKTVTDEQKRAKLQELRDAASDKIRSILSPEQQKTYEAMRKQALERRNPKDGK